MKLITIIITSLTLLTKKPTNNNSCTLHFKSEYPFRYKKKKTIINKLISRVKLISSSKAIFYKELKNIKQTLINNGFPNYIIDEQIKRTIRNINQHNKHHHNQTNKQKFIKHFYRNQMHHIYKLDQNISKTLIKRNILPLVQLKKIKPIYKNKVKTSNFVFNNNSPFSIGILQKNNVIYHFKCTLEDCISENDSIYVGLTPTTI